MKWLWNHIEFKNKTPFVMDRYNLGKDESSQVELDQPREVAARCLWVADDGETVVIPRDTIHRCIVEGGRFHKAKGTTLWSTRRDSLLPGIMDWGDTEAFPLEYDTWEVDVRAARVVQGGRVPKHRPIFHNCRFAIDVGIDVDVIHPNKFRDIVESALRRIGIGAMRVELKGLYGVFLIESWKEINEPVQRSSLRCQSLLEAFRQHEEGKKGGKGRRAA